MNRPFSYVIWTLIELLSIIFTLAGVVLIFAYFKSDEYAQHGLKIGSLVISVGLSLFGLVSYQMARGAKKLFVKGMIDG